jgi:hypothetical protein
VGKFKFDTARFHIELGPMELFDRVRFEMKDETILHFTGPHFIQRSSEREVPVEVLKKMEEFDCHEWNF